MNSCDKQCRIYKTRAAFFVLYKISLGLTVAEIIALILILLRAIIIVCCGPVSPDPIGWISGILPSDFFGGLKDVSMTVGLTGVLFAWLLQIIGDQTCGIQMDELFRFEFPDYIWQTSLFILATMVCIFTCSCKGTGSLLAPIAFLNMACGIVNMWLMCLAFLFSTSKRRDIAFCCLKRRLSKTWSMDNLSLWARELNNCAARLENGHIEVYFDLLRSKAEDAFKNNPVLCAQRCGELMNLTWNATGAEHWSRYLACLLKPPYNNPVPYFLMGTYLLQAARLQDKELDGQRYLSVILCLSNGTEHLQEVPGALLALYLAFYTVHQSVSGTQAPQAVFTALRKIQWDNNLDVHSSKAAYYRQCVLTWVLWSYGVVCASDYQAYIHKQGAELERDYNRYMELFPWKYIGQ